MFHRFSRYILILLASLLVNGCSTYAITPDTPHELIDVAFATNRNLVITQDIAAYGRERASLSFGKARVAIPKARKTTLTSRIPLFGYMQDRLLDPDRETRLAQLYPLHPEDLKTDLETNGNILIYIHGYNTSFEEAIKRAALLKYYMKYEGPVALFSWPSREEFLSYPVDETNAIWARYDFARLLKRTSAHPKIKSISIVTHSLGARLLASVFLNDTNPRNTYKGKLHHLIMAAPDIDAGLFENEIVPALQKARIPTTIYVSRKDQALQTSSSIHGYPRLGDFSRQQIAIDGLDIIDVTEAISGTRRTHTYYLSEAPVVEDMIQVIVDKRTAEQRHNLVPVTVENASYWRMQAVTTQQKARN